MPSKPQDFRGQLGNYRGKGTPNEQPIFMNLVKALEKAAYKVQFRVRTAKVKELRSTKSDDDLDGHRQRGQTNTETVHTERNAYKFVAIEVRLSCSAGLPHRGNIDVALMQ